MAKRRKAYSPHKRSHQSAKYLLRNMAVSYVTGDDYNQLVHIKRGPVPVNQQLACALADYPYRWSILIAVFGRDDQGNNYMKSELVETQQDYYQHELIELLNQQHKKLIDGFNRKHLLGAGWLASTRGRDWEEQEAFELFTKLGAFDRERNPDTGEIYVLPDKESSAA